MVPLGHGGDGGGSIRIPASMCGLFGLKPSRGRVSLGPDEGEAWAGLVVRHVITRTVRDSAAVLDVIAGPMPGDPYTAPPPRRPYLDEVGAVARAAPHRHPDGDPVEPRRDRPRVRRRRRGRRRAARVARAHRRARRAGRVRRPHAHRLVRDHHELVPRPRRALARPHRRPRHRPRRPRARDLGAVRSRPRDHGRRVPRRVGGRARVDPPAGGVVERRRTGLGRSRLRPAAHPDARGAAARGGSAARATPRTRCRRSSRRCRTPSSPRRST